MAQQRGWQALLPRTFQFEWGIARSRLNKRVPLQGRRCPEISRVGASWERADRWSPGCRRPRHVTNHSWDERTGVAVSAGREPRGRRSTRVGCPRARCFGVRGVRGERSGMVSGQPCPERKWRHAVSARSPHSSFASPVLPARWENRRKSQLECAAWAAPSSGLEQAEENMTGEGFSVRFMMLPPWQPAQG